eukprot:COSAG06_NODE_13393_length_1261_cov_20.651471_2_plen_88_part_00
MRKLSRAEVFWPWLRQRPLQLLDRDLPLRVLRLGCGKNRSYSPLNFLISKFVGILPRQARDNHKENGNGFSKMKGPFLSQALAIFSA